MGDQSDGRRGPTVDVALAADGESTDPVGPAAGGEEALRFPDAARLGLDELLDQLVERAQEVMGTQGRLRGLLRANRVVTADLTLPVVLRHIVQAARELVGARYAALGVIASDGHLAEFIHVGMTAEMVHQIGNLPQGKGLLGALIEDPRPIRLSRIAEDERSSGFPANHPEMRSFLGVPIRVRTEVFGNLYLAESVHGQFSAEDEELATALAGTAGVAIENARLFESARSRQDWLRASATITREVLTPDTASPLDLIAEHTRRNAHADVVTISLPSSDGRHLRVTVAVGLDATALLDTSVPIRGSLSGQVYVTGQPQSGFWPQEQSSPLADAPAGMDIDPVLIIPLGAQRVTGTLTAARRHGRPAFTAEDLDMATSFANQASVAIELGEARAEQQRTAMFDERDRIAADLHDHVVQRLFAAGMSLQRTASSLGAGPAADRIQRTIEDLDTTISQIRTTIFQLHHVTRPHDVSLRGRLLEVATEATPALGFMPAIRFAGQLEGIAGSTVTEDLLAVLREALSNIARHAHASSADVEITAQIDQITVEITDNGIGLTPTTRRSGLANMQTRAERHGGTLALTPHHPSGTHLTWTALITSP
jgi:signal transduction histidine kinase